MELQLDSADRRYVADRNAETQITIAAMKDESGKSLERVRADLKNAPIQLENEAIQETIRSVNSLRESVGSAIAELNTAVSELQEQANADVVPIRENGRLVGVKRGNRTVRIGE